MLSHSEPQSVKEGSRGLELVSQADYLWDDGLPETVSGVLSFEQNGKRIGQEVSLAVGQILDVGLSGASGPNAAIGGVTLWTAIIGALIGGLILNLMPCVFPVISIKAVSYTHLPSPRD